MSSSFPLFLPQWIIQALRRSYIQIIILSLRQRQWQQQPASHASRSLKLYLFHTINGIIDLLSLIQSQIEWNRIKGNSYFSHLLLLWLTIHCFTQLHTHTHTHSSSNIPLPGYGPPTGTMMLPEEKKVIAISAARSKAISKELHTYLFLLKLPSSPW